MHVVAAIAKQGDQTLQKSLFAENRRESGLSDSLRPVGTSGILGGPPNTIRYGDWLTQNRSSATPAAFYVEKGTALITDTGKGLFEQV